MAWVGVTLTANQKDRERIERGTGHEVPQTSVDGRTFTSEVDLTKTGRLVASRDDEPGGGGIDERLQGGHAAHPVGIVSRDGPSGFSGS